MELSELKIETVGYNSARTNTSQDIAWSKLNFKVGNKVILKDCYGEVPAGCVCAIMGPSGCGKSSLLNVLGNKFDWILQSIPVLTPSSLPPAYSPSLIAYI